MHIQFSDCRKAGAYEWRWPDGTIETYERSWVGAIVVEGQVLPFRHALGHRHTFRRPRVRAVTFLVGAPMVEGVEADDYPSSRSLLSVLRHRDRRLLRDESEVPPGYEGFRIVAHRDEIDAHRSYRSLAVKIRDDDVAAWAVHAALRARALGRLARPTRSRSNRDTRQAAPLPPPASVDVAGVVRLLVELGEQLKSARRDAKEGFAPTTNPAANTLINRDPFAFLTAETGPLAS